MGGDSWKRTFAVIWAGQFFSLLTSSLVNFGIVIWLSVKTGSAEILSLATIAALLPQTVIGPFAGVMIDRWNRKRVMMLSDSFIALCTLLLALLFAAGVARMWHIFLLLALRSVGSAFHMPAMQAAVPMIAPADQLTRVAGMDQIINSVSNIAGPALGAMLVALWDIEYVLLLDVAGAAIAVISLLFVHIPNPEKADARAGVLSEMAYAVRTVAANRGLGVIFIFSSCVMFFLMPVSVLFPLMTLDYFGGTELQAGFVEAVWSVGALIGGAVMGIKAWRVNRAALINWMNVVCGATFLVSGLLSAGGYVWFAFLTFVAGVSGAVFNAAFTGLVQSNIEPSALGRVFSMFYTLNLLPSMVGLVGIGFFADGLGLNVSFITCGAVIMLLGIAAFAIPSVMRLDRVKGGPA